MVAAVDGGKVTIHRGVTGRQQRLARRKVHLLSPLAAGSPVPRCITDPPWGLSADRLTQGRPSRRTWGQAWVLLHEAGETPAITEFCDLALGGVEPWQLAGCWTVLHGDQLLFRWRMAAVQPRPLADLRALRRQRWRERLAAQREQAWLAGLRRRQPLERSTLDAEQLLWLDQLQQLGGGELSVEQLSPALQRCLRTLQLGSDRGAIRHLLVDLGAWDPHRLITLEGSSWQQGFSPDLLDEAQRLADQSEGDFPGDAERLDLTGQHCVTIDDEDTHDIDDALGLERCSDRRLRIWIHVADPGRLIEADSPLDLEARRRGTSLYLARGILPMLPEVLSHGPLSLRQGIRTAAWSLWVELGASGEIVASGLQRSWVMPAYRLSYGDADDLIDLAPPEDPDLAELDRLMRLRRGWREQRGALLLDQPEGRIFCRSGEPELAITEPGPARLLVAEAMILAGAVIAEFARHHGLALPYRSQLPAALPPPAELAALPQGAVRDAAIKRCLSRGLVGSHPSPHFSLGLDAYVQATSPIRRYGDLLVQRQIGALLSGNSPLPADALEPLLQQLNLAVREAMTIAREDQRHWQQVWFETHRSAQWRARFLRWLRPQDQLALVRVDALALDLAAACPAGAEPGQSLLLRIVLVDSLRDQLQLQASPS